MPSPGGREEELFAAALERPPKERTAFLEGACHGDTALCGRVLDLLAAHDRTDVLQPHERPGLTSTQPVEPPTPQPDETVGSTIDRYKVLQRIGEGGCGVVYMAEQQEPIRRRVALKIIKLGMDTKAVIARFEAERQALALMDHPHIAKVLDAGSTDTGRAFFVMELVRGIPITDYCDRNKLNTDQRLELFIQVCQAVQHAHQKGIIHRDLKPSNILVTLHDGVPVPKVIDFGIAKATNDQRLTDKTLFTAYEQFIGTPTYMSPEQAEMSGLDVDTRSDIYSLGVLLYELLTGATPLDVKELLSLGFDAMRQTIRDAEPPKPSTRLRTMQGEQLTTTSRSHGADLPKLLHQVQGDLDWIVMKCLEKDRSRRYETANGLAMDIRRHLSTEPVIARPPSKLYEFQKTVRRHKVGFAATAAVIVVLALGILLTSWQAARATRAKREAVEAQTLADEQRRKAEANEERARTEAERSRQVAQFMRDMIEGVGPSVALGRDTTLLREILDDTALRIGNDLGYQPAVQADMYETLGRVYLAISEFDKAEEMDRNALALRKVESGPQSAETAALLCHLGMVLRQSGRDLDEAEQAVRDSLAIRRTCFGNESAEAAESLVVLGNILRERTRPDLAIGLFREALEIQRTVFGEESLEVVDTMFWLAVAMRGHNQGSGAEQMFREALAIQRKLKGDEHPLSARLLSDLGATVRRGQGRQEEGIALLREALAIERKLMGDKSRNTAFTLHHLSETLAQVGRLPEAEQYRREELDMVRALYGSQAKEVAVSLHRLAPLLQLQGKDDEIEPALREALAIMDEHHPENWNRGWIQLRYGALLLSQERYEESEPLLRLAYDGLRLHAEDLPGWLTGLPASAHDLLLQLYETTGRSDDALRLLRESMESDNPNNLNYWAWALATSPDPDRRDGARAVVLAEKAVTGTHREDESILDTLASAYAEAGRFEEAVATQKEALSLLTNVNWREDFTDRLNLYQAGRAYRVPVPAEE